MRRLGRAAVDGVPVVDEYRALQIFDRIPAGHVGVMVTGSTFEPHLRRGEVAIVDTTDKSLEFGELFVITLSEGTPHMSLAIVQLALEVPTLEGPGLLYKFGFPRGTGADGPLGIDYWPTKCVGRIVGVMKPMWEGR